MPKRKKLVSALDDLAKTVSDVDAEIHANVQLSTGKRSRTTAEDCCSGPTIDLVESSLPVVASASSLARPPSSQDEFKKLMIDMTLSDLVLLVQACKFVPSSYLHLRQSFITSILAAGSDTEFSKPYLSCAIATIDTQLCQDREFLPGVSAPSSDYLWKATNNMGMPYLRFLGPPVLSCLQCRSSLTANNAPTCVVLYTQDGPVPASKLILRCTDCQLNYHPDTYGNTAEGYRYYNNAQPVVKCTQQAYMDRQLCSMIASAGHHAWTSFESWAEIYNEVHRDSVNTNYTQQYFHEHPIVEKSSQEDATVQHCTGELTRKHVAEGFWNSEVEHEIRQSDINTRFTHKSSREDFMDEIDKSRASNPYPHLNCSEECQKRGCGTLWSLDGNWKLSYPICMYSVARSGKAFGGKLQYVSSCPNQPMPRMAFCTEHCQMAERQGFPTDLHGYLKHKSKEITSPANQVQNQNTAADCQGITKVLETHPGLSTAVDNTDEDETTRTSCNKDTGGKKTVQKWTRGHLFIVRGGGHIDIWQPLYQSEGPAQVFLIVLNWMIAALGHLDEEKRKKIILSYDNMCHLDNLRVAKAPLPLPGHLSMMWLDVQKIIDSLHIANHKDKRCQEKYKPAEVKELHPEYNSMCCEQTFAWLSRFKRILSSMPKTHHHFFLHRMVKRRNSYIEWCYLHGRRPVAPSKTTKAQAAK